MKSVLVLMIVLGCDDSETLCRHLKTVDGGFQSVASCTHASTDEIMKYSGADYPVVVARCQTTDQLGITTAETAPKPDAAPPAQPKAPATAAAPAPAPATPDKGPSAPSTVVAWTEAAAASAWNHVPGTAEVRTFIGTQGERVWKAFAKRVPWGSDDPS